MSKVQCFKEFVNERLTAAAEQIFRYLEETVAKYEEEIDRQRRLLDLIWKPEIRLRRAVVHEQREAILKYVGALGKEIRGGAPRTSVHRHYVINDLSI
ncbi:putative zinc finger protein 236-like [Scophthalmus maximus]|uniref:Putative zinc finger protein 236-like n=1 Tax=Scophthalmus maximus TaxID=52904 RepID=A0A2U9BSQ8_SCOMX|nr:putative zinc finger protein 236-like [Scophthalmus maximus]